MTAPEIRGRRGSRYDAALATLRRELTTGRFRDHDALPSERDLADVLTVSRTTLRRVLATLSEERVLAQRRGAGTFVNRPPRTDSPPLSGTPLSVGFAEDMRQRGHEPSGREIERGLVRPTALDALVLGCSPEVPVFRLGRLRYADGLPMAIERAVAPSAFLGDPSTVGHSLRATLQRQGFSPVRSLDRIQAALMDDGEAARLETAKGSPGLLVSRAAYLADGRCCLYSRSLFRADRYDILSERSARTSSDGDDG